jgi:hypothetical protein
MRKSVTRDGTTFQQTFWVKAADVAPKVRAVMRDIAKSYSQCPRTDRAFGGLVKEFGGDARLGSAIAKEWAKSSTSAKGIALRAAATNMVSDDVAERAAMAAEDLDDLLAGNPTYKGSKTTPEDIRAAHEDGLLRHDTYEKTLTAMSVISQSMYKEEEVVVYRGISAHQSSAMKSAVARGESTVDFDVGTITSFSESEATAKKFAGKDGAVIKQTIKRENIMFSHRAIGRLKEYGEQEVAVLSKGMMRINATDIAFAN